MYADTNILFYMEVVLFKRVQTVLKTVILSSSRQMIQKASTYRSPQFQSIELEEKRPYVSIVYSLITVKLLIQ